jgi:beta-glucosidase/6-phospho-beta-glucosidase/beta-galactosidase
VKSLGLEVLRYGLPWYQVHVGDGVYDWSRCDGPMDEMRRLGIEPILDLLHFGVPDWLGVFQNPELPLHFARYCSAVAQRYPWVRSYTPVNEIYVAARFSALDGIWNERLKSDSGFVTALKHLAACAIAGCAAIVRVRPDAVFVTSETAEYTHDMSAMPGDDIQLENRLRYLSFDLLYGKQPEALIYEYLLDNGMTREEFAWFMAGEPAGHQIMGNDYYGPNERLRLPDGTILEGQDVLGW